MSKLTMSAALAALLAVSGPALAQTMSPANAPATTGAAAPARVNHVMSGQIRFTDMNGATVYDGQNNKVGDISNVILDKDGRVAAVVIKTGAFLGIGGKNVAISMSDLKIANGSDNKPRFSVNMTKDQLKAAQSYEVTPPNNATGSSTPPTENSRRRD